MLDPGQAGRAFKRYPVSEREHGVPHTSRQRPAEVVWRGLTFDLSLKDKRLLFAADLLTLKAITLAESAPPPWLNETQAGKGKTGALEDFIDRGDEGPGSRKRLIEQAMLDGHCKVSKCVVQAGLLTPFFADDECRRRDTCRLGTSWDGAGITTDRAGTTPRCSTDDSQRR